MRVANLTDEQRAVAPKIATLVDALTTPGHTASAFVHARSFALEMLALGAPKILKRNSSGAGDYYEMWIAVGDVGVTALVNVANLPEVALASDPFASVPSPENGR